MWTELNNAGGIGVQNCDTLLSHSPEMTKWAKLALASVAIVPFIFWVALPFGNSRSQLRYEGQNLNEWLRGVEGASSSEQKAERLDQACLAVVVLGPELVIHEFRGYLRSGSKAERFLYQAMPYRIRLSIWRSRIWRLYGRKEAVLDVLHRFFEGNPRSDFPEILTKDLHQATSDLFRMASDSTEFPDLRARALSLLERTADHPPPTMIAAIERLTKDADWLVSSAARLWLQRVKSSSEDARFRAAEATFKKASDASSTNTTPFEPVWHPESSLILRKTSN